MDRRAPYASLPPPPPNQSQPSSFDAASEGRFGSPVELYRLVRSLWDGRRWLLLSVILGAVAGLTVGKLMTRTYKATVVIKYDGPATTLPGALPVGPRAVNLAAEALRTERVLGTIKHRMSIPGPLSLVTTQIETIPEPEVGLLRMKIGSESPRRAALFANTAAEVLISRLDELERARFVETKEMLLERRQVQEAALTAARNAYDLFRETHGIANLTTEQEQGITHAATLRADRDLGEAEIHALEARVGQLRRESGRTPRMVTTASTASAERTDLQRLESELASARGSLSDEHPRVKALELQIAGLRRRIESGHGEASLLTYGASGQFQDVQQRLSTAEGELAAARERMNEVSQLATQAQTRVAEFSQIEGEAATLLAAVRVNEALTAELHEQVARVEAVAQQGDAGFRVLTPAQVPEQSESSSKKMIAVVAIPSFLFLVVALVLLVRELRGLRIKTASELAYWGRAPVVASTTWPRDLHGLDDLIGDMDDCAPAAAGRTLVVGVSDAQAVLAQTIASRLGEDWRSSVISMQGAVASSWRPPAGSSSPPAPARTPESAQSREADLSKKVTLMGYSTPIPERRSEAASRDTFTGNESPIPDPLHVPPTTIAPRMRGGMPSGLMPYRDVEPWDGPVDGPALRRAARLADRVAVVVPAGQCSVLDVAGLQTRLGRRHGVGFILVDVQPEFARLSDRSGPVESFWSATRVD